MRGNRGKGNRKKLTDSLKQALDNQVFVGVLIAVCVLIMGLSLYSITRAIRIMRESALAEAVPEPLAVETPDPYFVPTREPVPVLFTPIPTSTPEPVPESPWGWKEREGFRIYLLENGNPLTGLRLIDGKLHYFNLHGQRAKALGVDISYHNKGINWDAVRAQGVDFAIVRLGYRGWETGLLHEDNCFLQNLRGAKAAGLRVGVYLYSTAVNVREAKEEAAFILSRLNGFPLDLPVYFDTEQSGEYPNGRADKLCKSRRYEIISSFCRTIQDGGYSVGVYSGQNFLKNHVAFHTLEANPVWLASYTVRNQLPDFPYAYYMWQFTDRGVVAGIRGVADFNVIY